MSKNALQKTSTSVSVPEVPDHLKALAEKYGTNAGLEAIDQSDLKRPFYRIIQPTSSELVDGEDRYLENAKAGMFIEGAITKELSRELKIVPIKFIKGYTEFVPQNMGGGFVGFHPEESNPLEGTTQKDYCTYITSEGNELKYTMQVFFLIDPEGRGKAELGMMALTGGALAEAKIFLTYAAGLRLPFFAKQYRLTTFANKNKKFNSTTYRPSFNVEESTFVSEEISKAAGILYDQLNDAYMQALVAATAEVVDGNDNEVDAAVSASMG